MEFSAVWVFSNIVPVIDNDRMTGFPKKKKDGQQGPSFQNEFMLV